jgi:CubicO group peptidase (beta-lactamase class C family)
MESGLRDWIRAERERWHVPALVVGLLRDGEVEVAADGGATRETPFRIASITKPFTATLAVFLAAEGRLSPDEPPPGTRVEATIRQLLSHQGGIACEWPRPLGPYGSGNDALLRLSEEEPEYLPVGPGELFSYSNVGYWLVGAPAARALGRTFEEAVMSRVVAPMGGRGTAFDRPPDAARGHDQVEPGADAHRPVEDCYPRVRRPSGGLWSTVPELLRFAEMHLEDPTLAEMQQPQIAMPGGAYGLGWGLREVDGRRIVEHGGSAAGYESLLLLVPEERCAVAALSNSSRGRAAIRGILERLGLAPPHAPDLPLDDEALEALTGLYRGQDTKLVVERADGRLRVQLTEGDPFKDDPLEYPPVLARAIGEREFEVVDGEWRGERLDFPRDGFARFGTLAKRVE